MENIKKLKYNKFFCYQIFGVSKLLIPFSPPPTPLSKWRHWLSDPRASIKENN